MYLTNNYDKTGNFISKMIIKYSNICKGISHFKPNMFRIKVVKFFFYSFLNFWVKTTFYEMKKKNSKYKCEQRYSYYNLYK